MRIGVALAGAVIAEFRLRVIRPMALSRTRSPARYFWSLLIRTELPTIGGGRIAVRQIVGCLRTTTDDLDGGFYDRHVQQ